jgi:hypothetical protein
VQSEVKESEAKEVGDEKKEESILTEEPKEDEDEDYDDDLLEEEEEEPSSVAVSSGVTNVKKKKLIRGRYGEREVCSIHLAHHSKNVFLCDFLLNSVSRN